MLAIQTNNCLLHTSNKLTLVSQYSLVFSVFFWTYGSIFVQKYIYHYFLFYVNFLFLMYSLSMCTSNMIKTKVC